MSVNKLLTLISYKCMKKGTSQHQWTRKISTFIFKTVHLNKLILKGNKSKHVANFFSMSRASC